MHAYTHIYTYTRMCITCSECVRRCVRWCSNHTCVTFTPAHALVPKTPVPKCMQHSLQKNAHMHIPTHICIRIHMHTNAHAHAWHSPHAEALILRPTIYVQICIHIHIHMCINAYIYIYIHTCISYIWYMSAHIHTYTYIHTHIQYVQMHTHKHGWNVGAAATAQGADADAGSFARLFRRLWFPTSDRLETWLIPSGTTRSRQQHESTMVWGNLSLYHLCKCLLTLCHNLFVRKDNTKY